MDFFLSQAFSNNLNSVHITCIYTPMLPIPFHYLNLSYFLFNPTPIITSLLPKHYILPTYLNGSMLTFKNMQ